MHVCVCACMCVCVCVRACVCIYIWGEEGGIRQGCMHFCMHILVCTCMHVHMYSAVPSFPDFSVDSALCPCFPLIPAPPLPPPPFPLSSRFVIILCPGRFPSEQEYILQSVQPLPHPKKRPIKSKFDPAWASYNDRLPKHLPPLPEKPQVCILLSPCACSCHTPNERPRASGETA